MPVETTTTMVQFLATGATVAELNANAVTVAEAFFGATDNITYQYQGYNGYGDEANPGATNPTAFYSNVVAVRTVPVGS